MTKDSSQAPGREYCTYEQFGVDFFRLAVTRERVEAGINALAGQHIDVGPIGVGPGRLVRLTAKGTINEATVTGAGGDEE